MACAAEAVASSPMLGKRQESYPFMSTAHVGCWCGHKHAVVILPLPCSGEASKVWTESAVTIGAQHGLSELLGP